MSAPGKPNAPGKPTAPGSGAQRLLSVVIPVYNRVHQIGAAVESVLTQEMPQGWDRQLIVVDDGSDDGTAEFLRGYGEALQLVPIPHSGYPGAVRNRGVEVATGDLLAFLDSDDRWLPGKLLRQLPLQADTDARCSHTRERWVRRGRVVSQAGQRHRREGDIFADALHKCIIGPSTVMIDAPLYRRLGGFREDLEVAEDYEFWLRLLMETPVAYLDEELTIKRAGEWDQLSEKHGQIEPFRIRALRDLVESGVFGPARAQDSAAREPLVRETLARETLARETLARKLRIYARGARKRGRVTEADACEAEADQYAPAPGQRGL